MPNEFIYNMATKVVARVWTFVSDSNPDKEYETLQYTDASTSCNCPGWTRRVTADGQRTCKHTRLVDQGRADAVAVSSQNYQAVNRPTPSAAKPKSKKAEGFSEPGKREFVL